MFSKTYYSQFRRSKVQRNIEQLKSGELNLNQKNKYDCSSFNNLKLSHKNITSPTLKSDNENKVDDSIVEQLLKEIEKAKNYQLEIPELDYKTTTNIEMLKNIIFKYEQIKNNSNFSKLDNFKLLKNQIIEIKVG